MGFGTINLKLQRDVDQGPYFEFNISGNERRCQPRGQDSLFLDEAVFNIFADCFSNSAKDFNYFGPTKYDRADLLNLRKELGSVHSRLAEINNPEQFREKVAALSGGKTFLSGIKTQFDLDIEWEEVLLALQETRKELVEVVNLCIREGRVLWVLGL